MPLLDSIQDFLHSLTAIRPQVMPAKHGDVVILADGNGHQAAHVLDLEKYGARPHRRHASPSFQTVDSFAAYHAIHNVPDETVVMFDPDKLQCAACFDYLPAASAENGRAGAWKNHIARLAIANTPEWTKWLAAVKRGPMAQDAFAEFLDDMAHTITKPTAADLLEMVQNLQETRTVSFGAKTSLSKGLRSFTYTEDNGENHAVKVPEEINIRVVLTEAHAEPRELPVKVRFRWTSEHRPAFSLAIPGLDQILRDEAGRIHQALVNALGSDVPVLIGSL